MVAMKTALRLSVQSAVITATSAHNEMERRVDWIVGYKAECAAIAGDTIMRRYYVMLGCRLMSLSLILTAHRVVYTVTQKISHKGFTDFRNPTATKRSLQIRCTVLT